MAILEVENLRKSFGEIEVLKDISFSLERGEALSIIGSSGSGKTTLLRCLNFLENPTDGKIVINTDEGREVLFDGGGDKALSDSEKRRNRLHLGLVFQSFNLFPQYTALENVTLAPLLLAKERPDYNQNKKQIHDEIEENAKALLDRVGLSDRMNNYPCQLSGGQQQRVSIARALALNPKVLFFDEPTSALDPELTGEILRVIRDLASKDMTMVIVTHEIEFARNVADRIIFMADGVVLEDGTPEQVLDKSKNIKTRTFLQKLNKGIDEND